VRTLPIDNANIPITFINLDMAFVISTALRDRFLSNCCRVLPIGLLYAVNVYKTDIIVHNFTHNHYTLCGIHCLADYADRDCVSFVR